MANEERIEIALPTPAKILTPGVVALLVLMVVGYIITVYAKDFAMGYLALDPRQVMGGMVWQLVTYNFVDGGMSLVWSLILLLFMGSAIEREWSTKSFLTFWLTVAVACALVWMLVSWVMMLTMRQTLIGGMTASGASYGLIAVFGLVFRRRRFFYFFWTMEGQHIAILMIAIGLLTSIAQPLYLIWVAGALVGYVYVRIAWGDLRLPTSKPATGSRFKDL